MASGMVPGTISMVDPFVARRTIFAPCGRPVKVSAIGASNPCPAVTSTVNSPCEPAKTDNDVGWIVKSKSVTVTITFAVRCTAWESGGEYEAVMYNGNDPNDAFEFASRLTLIFVPGCPLVGAYTLTPLGAPETDIVNPWLKPLIDVTSSRVKDGLVEFRYTVTV